MILQILTILSFITRFCKADTINFVTPTIGQMLTNPLINVNYQIQRNGMLFISNTTTDLLDSTGNLLLNSAFTDTTLNTNVNVEFDTTKVLLNTSNFNIRITGFGRYNLISNGSVNVLFMNIQNIIPINVDLSSGLVTNPKPNVVVFNPPITTSVPVVPTSVVPTTMTLPTNPIVGILSPKTNSTTSVNSTMTATDNSTATSTMSNGDVNVNKLALSMLVIFMMMFNL